MNERSVIFMRTPEEAGSRFIGTSYIGTCRVDEYVTDYTEEERAEKAREINRAFQQYALKRAREAQKV